MFGGFNSDTLYDDLWQYNIYSNMWSEISVSDNKPNGVKGHHIVKFSEGFALYGGATWYITNLTSSDNNAATAE